MEAEAVLLERGWRSALSSMPRFLCLIALRSRPSVRGLRPKPPGNCAQRQNKTFSRPCVRGLGPKPPGNCAHRQKQPVSSAGSFLEGHEDIRTANLLPLCDKIVYRSCTSAVTQTHLRCVAPPSVDVVAFSCMAHMGTSLGSPNYVPPSRDILISGSGAWERDSRRIMINVRLGPC